MNRNGLYSKYSIYFYLTFYTILIYAIVNRIWVAEDAYISFRYILNFVEGNGLVFNKGEYIEGFTHPYWLFLVLLLHLIGIPFHQGSIILGILFTIIGTTINFISLKKNQSYIFLFPSIVISHEGFRDFSSSGLEFSLTYLLLSILLAVIYNNKLNNPFFIGMISSLLYHTRPEMGLLFPFFFIWKIYEEKRINIPWIIIFSFSIFIFGGLYHIFRYYYYHDIFPNTFYAKSGSGSRYYDGLKYLFHFLFYSKFFVISFISCILFLLYRYYKYSENSFNLASLPYREIIMAFLISFYIIRVGGDFMGFRLLLPYFVIFVYCLDRYMNLLIQEILSDKSVFYINLFLILITVGLVMEKSNYPLVDRTGVVNERKAYTKGYYEDLREIFQGIKYSWYLRGQKFNELQKCINQEDFIITNSVTDAKCNEEGFGLGYFSVAAGVNVKVIDELGLTDREIAKSGVKSAHERVGHERSISLEDIIKRKALFCSLEDNRYDEIMKTKYGVIIKLDQEFLYSLNKEDYERKILDLKILYEKLLLSSNEKDLVLLNKLKLIQDQYNTRIIELKDKYPDRAQSPKLRDCWN